MNLVKNYVIQKELDMKNHCLIQAFIREAIIPNEIFFVVDKTNFDNEKRSFWNEILFILEAAGFQASVGDQKLWSRTERLWGWAVLL